VASKIISVFLPLLSNKIRLNFNFWKWPENVMEDRDIHSAPAQLRLDVIFNKKIW
jgi:hypothetical protein